MQLYISLLLVVTNSICFVTQDYTIRMDRATDEVLQTSSSGSYSSESLHTQENNDKEPTSPHLEDNESPVDLTEPWFESFSVSNVSSASKTQ